MTIASGTRPDVPSTTAPLMAPNRVQPQEAATSASPSSSAQPRRMRICTSGSPLSNLGWAFGEVIEIQYKLLNSGLDVRDGSERSFHRRSERLAGLPWPSPLWNYQRLTAFQRLGSGQFRGEFSVSSCRRLI